VWKWIIGTVIFLVVVVVGGGAALMATGKVGGLRNAGNDDESGLKVQIQQVGTGELVRVVSAPGSIEPRRKVEISAQVSARILALPFREGETIKAGDVLVRLDARDLSAALSSAEAGLKSEEARLDGAKADFMRAQAQYGRTKELYDSKDESLSELDLAEADFLLARSRLRQAEQSIEIAKANIEQRKKNLDNAVITSPIDGTITTLNAEVGETVIVGTMNNQGSLIMEVADLSTMLLKAQVDEANIAPVKAGQRATIYVNAYSDRTYDGTVERIALKRQVAADGVGYFETEILLKLPDGERLYSGLTANTEIEVETIYDTLKVPSQAVGVRRIDELPRDVVRDNQYINDKKVHAEVVFVVDEDGKTRITPVSTGPSDVTHTVILGGLEPTDRVVVGPFKVLADLGHKVKIRDMDAELDEDDEQVADGDGDEVTEEEDAEKMAESDTESADIEPDNAEVATDGSGDDTDDDSDES